MIDPAQLAAGAFLIDGPHWASIKHGGVPFTVFSNITDAVEMKFGITPEERDAKDWVPYRQAFSSAFPTLPFTGRTFYITTRDDQEAETEHEVPFNRRWMSYKYLSGDQCFFPVTWEANGGPDDLPYFWTDASRWNHDVPDASVLAAINYFASDGPALRSIRNKTMTVRLRGRSLDLEGGAVYFHALGETYPTSARNPRYTHPTAMTPGDGVWSTAYNLSMGNDATGWTCSHDCAGSEPLDLDFIKLPGFSFRGFTDAGDPECTTIPTGRLDFSIANPQDF